MLAEIEILGVDTLVVQYVGARSPTALNLGNVHLQRGCNVLINRQRRFAIQHERHMKSSLGV